MAQRATQRRNRIAILGALAAIIVVGVLIFANRPTDPDVPEIIFDALPSNGTVLGSDTATVQIVEYADYQCPFCAQFATTVVPHMIEDFVEPGHATFEFRAFPFLGEGELESPGNESVRAAEAAMCALDQDRFWEYNHHLFENHDGENQGAFSDNNLNRFAAGLGLDTDQFSTCLASGQHQEQVIEQFFAARDVGINSTPTIFINGQPVTYTVQGYDLLKRQIEAAIAGELIPLS